MQDICEEAGLSPGAVYRYFRSKEEIIEAMSARGQSQNAAAIEAAMSLPDTRDVFEELIHTFFESLDDGPQTEEMCALNIELISEAPRSARIRESLVRNNFEVRSRFTQLIRRAQERGEVNAALDPESVARAMIAVYHGYITQKLVQPDLDLAGYAEVLRALFCGSFWQGEVNIQAASDRSPAVLRH